MIDSFFYKNKLVEYLYLEADKKEKNKRIAKKKSTTVLYLPGINDPVQNHIDFYKEINKLGFDVYAINFPGFGNSEKFRRISWELLSDICIDFVEKKQLANITLFGYSMGSHIAIRLLEDLNNISEIKIIAPVTHHINIFNLNFLRQGLVFASRLYVKGLMHYAGKSRPFSTNTLYVFKNYYSIFKSEIYEYNSIRVPTRIIILGDDEIIKENKVYKVFSKFPNVEIIKFENVTHDLYYVKRKVVSEMVHRLFN